MALLGKPQAVGEDIRAATGFESGLLESRDHGYFTVDLPNFWEREEMSGLLRDVRAKPDKYAWLDQQSSGNMPTIPMTTQLLI